MIKHLIAAVCLSCGLAQADTVATATNGNGGRLVLTDLKCGDKRPGMIAYSATDNKPTLMGCWFTDENFLFIRWDDGDLRSYPFGIWTMTKKKGADL